ncbi:hypothetical protein B0H11DRAFT_1890644, partial [Mycena galericulata]
MLVFVQICLVGFSLPVDSSLVLCCAQISKNPLRIAPRAKIPLGGCTLKVESCAMSLVNGESVFKRKEKKLSVACTRPAPGLNRLTSGRILIFHLWIHLRAIVSYTAPHDIPIREPCHEGLG